jgi:hypothetical protein
MPSNSLFNSQEPYSEKPFKSLSIDPSVQIEWIYYIEKSHKDQKSNCNHIISFFTVKDMIGFRLINKKLNQKD